LVNGARGTRDIEGKVTRVGASECGQRKSFNRSRTVSCRLIPQSASRDPRLLFTDPGSVPFQPPIASSPQFCSAQRLNPSTAQLLNSSQTWRCFTSFRYDPSDAALYGSQSPIRPPKTTWLSQAQELLPPRNCPCSQCHYWLQFRKY